MKTTTFTLIAILFTFNLFAAPISVQGVLRDVNNRAVADGSYNLTFSVYGSADGSTVLWGPESQTATLLNGVYNLSLDFTTTLLSSVSEQLWLEISVDNELMDERVRLHLSPYEFIDLTTSGDNHISSAGDVNIGA